MVVGNSGVAEEDRAYPAAGRVEQIQVSDRSSAVQRARELRLLGVAR